jgi:N5-(cytidine 5'-diphosphoramidyl)-L-glutamine hydrolase
LKRVALSQAVMVLPERNERRDTLDQRLTALLSSLRYLPIPVPNVLQSGPLEDTVAAWLDEVNVDAIVLSGGNDIGSCPERDLTESRLLEYARSKGLPALGICRGMQMMGTWSGATLAPVTGHVRTRHQLHGELSGSVNSFHNFALAQCPPDFVVIAHSEDDSIEAIRHTSLPWEGWMWHPEREATFAAADLQRLQTLFGD